MNFTNKLSLTRCFNSANVASNGIDETPRLPSEIFLLSSLKVLNLGDNSFSGSIPTEIGLLSDLVNLHLGINTFIGSVPTEIGLFSELVDLKLGDNQITGRIPSELGLISTLQILSLEQNALTGPIPSELGQIPSLQDLYLYDNVLTGTFPMELPTRMTFSYKFVKQYVPSQVLQNTSSPQYEALEWMAYSDSITIQSTMSDDELVERFALALLYFATAGESWLDQAGFLTPLNTCSCNSTVVDFFDGTTRVLGVSCNEEGYVVTLDLCTFPKQ
jgi:hypothetical protein